MKARIWSILSLVVMTMVMSACASVNRETASADDGEIYHVRGVDRTKQF